MTTLSDHELEVLYDRHAPMLMHRCLSILGDEAAARDAVQDTFARALRHGDRFRGEASPVTWLYRISTNLCLNRLRDQRSRERKHVDHAESIGPAEASTSVWSARDRERILTLLDDADDETRRCVIHTFFDDCTRAETATLVGISVPTVRKRLDTFLARARRAFEAMLPFLFVLWSAR